MADNNEDELVDYDEEEVCPASYFIAFFEGSIVMTVLDTILFYSILLY